MNVGCHIDMFVLDGGVIICRLQIEELLCYVTEHKLSAVSQFRLLLISYFDATHADVIKAICFCNKTYYRPIKLFKDLNFYRFPSPYKPFGDVLKICNC